MFKEEKEIEEPKSGPNILHLIAYGIKANNSSIKLRDLNWEIRLDPEKYDETIQHR